MCAVQRGMGGAVLQAQDLSRPPGAKAQGTEGEKPGQYPAGRATQALKRTRNRRWGGGRAHFPGPPGAEGPSLSGFPPPGHSRRSAVLKLLVGMRVGVQTGVTEDLGFALLTSPPKRCVGLPVLRGVSLPPAQ